MRKLFHKLYLVPGVDMAFGHQLRAWDFKQVVVVGPSGYSIGNFLHFRFYFQRQILVWFLVIFSFLFPSSFCCCCWWWAWNRQGDRKTLNTLTGAGCRHFKFSVKNSSPVDPERPLCLITDILTVMSATWLQRDVKMGGEAWLKHLPHW